MATSLPRAAPPLAVERREWTHAVGEAIHLKTDALTGDKVFDRYFFVTASEQSAALLLQKPVRDALMKLASYAPPSLRVSDGTATLRWSYAFLGETIERAASVLALLRHTHLDVQLLRS